MEFNEYHALARATASGFITDGKDQLINAALGLAGESGECCDIIKKWIHQGHPLNPDKLKLELGDVLWYITQAASGLGITLEDVAVANVEKLKARYPNGFSTADSLNRSA